MLARLNCDKPCFRRAKDAHIVAAPANTFVSCGSNDPYYGGHRERQLATMSASSTLIIEVEFEQTGVCTTALDGKTGMGKSAHPEDYKDGCGVPPWAYTLPYYQNVCYPSSSDHNDETCCCICGTDRSLAEADLAQIYSASQTLSTLRISLQSTLELFSRKDCSGDLKVQFERGVLLGFSGTASQLNPSDSGSLIDSVSNGYNELTFSNCDGLGRAIVGGDAETVDPGTFTRRRLQRGGRYVNSYSSRVCLSRACAAARVDAEAGCPANVCPQTDDLDLFSGDFSLRRTLSSEYERIIEKDTEAPVAYSPERKAQDLGGIERVLQGASSTPSPREFIARECMCPTHEETPTGQAPTNSEFVDQFNVESESGGDLQGLGTLAEAIELKIFPTAGVPRDVAFWLPIYVRGSPCNLDYKELQGLADVIQTSYNDIVIEECDKPLFRQILSGVTWMDPVLNCYQTEFVVHVKLALRCHGKCPKMHPLFGSYEDKYRQLLQESEIEVEEADVLYDPAQYDPELQGHVSTDPDASFYQKVDQDIRREQTVPGTEGVCFIGGARNPMPPTIQGVEDRVNDDLPTTDISSISILLEPFCRCEGLYEHFYVGKAPKDFKYFRTINGIYVVPNEFKSCKYQVAVGAYPCSSFF
uniref:Uncharacterized protein n=1 Tax=Amphora coffeiformis TaxID=265554 RepID=A0A7S3PD53_9STRA